MKKIDMAQTFKNLGQWFKSIPQMDKKVLTLNIIKIVCYLLTFPALFIATMVVCSQVAEGMSFYTFWPYLAAIIVVLLGLIFGGVAIWLNCKKATKRSIMQKTAILLIVCIVLTAGIGLIFDIALPDMLAHATFGTLYVEDMYHRGVEESRVVENYIHLFIGLNILNGNYDGELYYDNVKAEIIGETGDVKDSATVKAISGYEDFKAYAEERGERTFDVFEDYWFGEYNTLVGKDEQYTELDHELYEFIYEHYVLMDYDFALANNVNRKAFCLALVDVYSDTYKQLCKEGFKTNSIGALGCTGNEKLTAIYGQNYATQDMDGYIPINEDSGIPYVTNGRMTTPLIVRMFLNDSYNYTTPIYGEDGKTIVGYDGFLAYVYRPEIAEQYTGEFDENGRGKEIFLADDGSYYYAYNTGHVDTAYNWCILDLLGEPMPLAELNVGELIGMPDLSDIINAALASQNKNIEDLLEEGLTNRVVTTVADGQKLHLNVYITDDGNVAATLYPQGMKDGYIGYQYMAWLEMGNLLTAVCGLVQTRNLLYIFGAISMVMIFAVAFLEKLIEDRKKELGTDKAEETETPAEDTEEVVADEVVEDNGDALIEATEGV